MLGRPSFSLRVLPLAVSFCAVALISVGVSAETGSLSEEYPELAKLYNAFDVSQAKLFDTVLEINADPSTAQAQDQLAEQLDLLANMTFQQMIQAGLNHGDAQIVMESTYTQQETEARIELARLVLGNHSLSDAADAFTNSMLPESAAKVISRGRAFEREIYDIYADTSRGMVAKRRHVDAAVEAYLSDKTLAVIDTPKSAGLYLGHDQALGLKASFPKLSGLMWSNQWLQLASLEAIVLGQLDPQFAGRVELTLERYRNKLGSEAGLSMFPPPSEMPTVPAIAPALYSQAPHASVIIDNLNMLEVAVADILAYPNVDNREEAVNRMVAIFTDENAGLTDTEQYLTAALRGGIFNQGGPAIGALDQSERNRSRTGMNMQRELNMALPNH